MNEYIKNITANSYTGEFEHSADGLMASGNFGTDAAKKINSFSGRVMDGNNLVCNFACNPWNNPITFNYTDVADPEALIDAISLINNTYNGVVAELESVN